MKGIQLFHRRRLRLLFPKGFIILGIIFETFSIETSVQILTAFLAGQNADDNSDQWGKSDCK